MHTTRFSWENADGFHECLLSQNRLASNRKLVRPCFENPGALCFVPALLHEFGHQASPAGLMARSDTGAVVSMKVFMEQDQVSPMRICLELALIAVNGPAPVDILQKDVRQATRQFVGDFPQIHQPARSSRTLYSERIAIVVVKFLQRLNQQEIHGKPNRPSPV